MEDKSNKVRRCGQIGNGDDDEVSIAEVLEEQRRLQADASAVLGASDPSNCTYPKGYLKRQALYACATCTPNGNAGICLACSYACHEGHDLYELYTKRFFCCDCGNAKFGGKECKLAKDKQMNSRNRYNQNFQGLYCSCSRPYPDPEDSVEDEMIQCVICEDWLHGRHLKCAVSDDFVEMTCPECMSKYPFLWAYQVSRESDVVKQENPDADDCKDIDVKSMEPVLAMNKSVDKELKADSDTAKTTDEQNFAISSTSTPNGSQSPSKEEQVSEYSSTCEGQSGACGVKTTTAIAITTASSKRDRDADSDEEVLESKVLKTEQSEDVKTERQEGASDNACLLQSLQAREYDTHDRAAFWLGGWRQKLCTCNACMEMYNDKEIDFLVDESDTVQAYEDAGTQNGSQAAEEEEDQDIFAGMHRVQQIEVAQGVRDLKTGLNEFLQSFVTEGKVVTETDIREFFQSLEEKRRRRMNLPQDNCR